MSTTRSALNSVSHIKMGNRFTFPVIADVSKQYNYRCWMGTREGEGGKHQSRAPSGAVQCGDVRRFSPCESLLFIHWQMSAAKNSQSPLFRDAYPCALLWFPRDALPRSRVHSCLAARTQGKTVWCKKHCVTPDDDMSVFAGHLINPTPTPLSTQLQSSLYR